ncbi:MAG: signal recognition particle protein [Clostridiales bacterium]|nr:signal recognition particle protein [Clostridiales bacterium]MDD7347958.1 signal recognition particle protein [Clostridiales bacterium]MDY4060774.1 signal recognition particle protein [Anaerovoracaceae bacterium]
MAFESLSEKLQQAFGKLKNKGVITEKDLNDAMREVKLALLEADVNFKVVKEFVASVKEKSMGAEVMKSLTPSQQIIKIVDQELVQLLGGTASKLTYSPSGFSIYMLVGLQGTGKTTTAGKLANFLKQSGKKPMLCACDIYRPAAIDQLEVVGKGVNTPVYVDRESRDPSEIAAAAKDDAIRKGYNVLIVDTAGRLQIDTQLMNELVDIKGKIKPHEILLVVDALTGQDAVNVADGFNKTLGIDGIIMTKMDGDSRGGAALSTKKVTGKPIKFIGVGEKQDALQVFHPQRMASRILGMGDMLSLIEEAEKTFDDEQAAKMEEKLKKNQFTLEDFLEQMGQVKKMGGIGKILDMLPGMNKAQMQGFNLEESEREFKAMEAIIQSMTIKERRDPSLLNASRRKRIAAGSGRSVAEINQLIKKYTEAKKMLKQFRNPGAIKRNKLFRGLV